jgi:predicted amidophosphoribosyltransferase
MNLKRKEAVTKTHNKGLCVNCKKPLDREGWYCVKCVEYFKIWQRERIKKLSGEGLCVQCGKNVVAKSNIRCEKCLDKNRIEAKKKRWLKRTKLKIKEGGLRWTT